MFFGKTEGGPHCNVRLGFLTSREALGGPATEARLSSPGLSGAGKCKMAPLARIHQLWIFRSANSG
jgi:hypothetical protein